MPSQDTAAIVAKRRDVLAALSTPKTKPNLVAELDASRSTVDRAIESLMAHSLVEREGSHYEATFAGREALAVYDQFLDRLDALERAQPILGELPADVDIDPAVLEGATVVESVPAAPAAPVEETIKHMRRANRFRGLGPVVTPLYIDVVETIVENNGANAELVLTEAVVDVLTETYPDGFATLRAADGLSLYVTQRTMPYCVWTAETADGPVSGIIVSAENGLVGIVNNDTDAMNEWARKRYDQFRADARRLD